MAELRAEATRFLEDLKTLALKGMAENRLLQCEALRQSLREIFVLSDERSEQAKVLRTFMLDVIDKRLNDYTDRKHTYNAAPAMREFLGERDESRPNPQMRPDYELGSDLNLRLLRGGQCLPEPLDSARNAREHRSRMLPVLAQHYTDHLQDDQAIRNFAKRHGLPMRKVSQYINRPALEAQFRCLVNNGAKLIAIVGFPGMGKTAIAKMMTASFPLIEFQEGRPLLGYLQGALEKYGLGEYVTTEQNATVMLAKLMNVKLGPRFVRLDSLQSTSELRDIVPPYTTATVVATCRERGDKEPAWCEVIEVDRMEQHEAKDLAQMLMPSLSDSDAELVAYSCDRCPRIIERACREELDPQDLYRTLEIDLGIKDARSFLSPTLPIPQTSVPSANDQ